MRGSHLDWRRGICVVFILLACLSISTVVGAASEESVEAAEITLPEDLTKPEVRDLISRLSDDQVRALLISQLDKLASAESASASEARTERRPTLSHGNVHAVALEVCQALRRHHLHVKIGIRFQESA